MRRARAPMSRSASHQIESLRGIFPSQRSGCSSFQSTIWCVELLSFDGLEAADLFGDCPFDRKPFDAARTIETVTIGAFAQDVGDVVWRRDWSAVAEDDDISANRLCSRSPVANLSCTFVKADRGLRAGMTAGSKSEMAYQNIGAHRRHRLRVGCTKNIWCGQQIRLVRQ